MSIADVLDYVNDHKVYRYLYLIAISFIWIKFKATRIYAVLAIWLMRRKLTSHALFENIDLLTVQIPVQIRNMGKRESFMDFLRLESGMFIVLMSGFIKRMTKTNYADKSFPYIIRQAYEFFLYVKDFDYTHNSLAYTLLSEYDIFLRDIPSIMENAFYSNIEIKQKDIIRYVNRNLDHVPDSKESEFIREIIKRQKVKILIGKYEQIMFQYRVQIKKNLALQMSNDINLNDMMKAILKYSFQSVYKAMEITFPMQVNSINGELKDVIYNGFDCLEGSK